MAEYRVVRRAGGGYAVDTVNTTNCGGHGLGAIMYQGDDPFVIDMILRMQEMEDKDMSGREVPFSHTAICDLCGKKGAFDFMGDLVCEECSSKVLDKEEGDDNDGRNSED